MKLEFLQKEMITAMKAGNKMRKEVISSLVSAVKKAGIDNGCRDNIPEDMVNKTLLKEMKTIQEMIDTCPSSRVETLNEYTKRKKIIEEFAPVLIGDPAAIKNIILSLGIEINGKNRGAIMKALNGKVDMKTAGKVLGDILASQ